MSMVLQIVDSGEVGAERERDGDDRDDPSGAGAEL